MSIKEGERARARATVPPPGDNCCISCCISLNFFVNFLVNLCRFLWGGLAVLVLGCVGGGLPFCSFNWSKLGRNWGEIGEKLGRNWCEMHQKLLKMDRKMQFEYMSKKCQHNWLKLVENWFYKCQKLVENGSKISRKLV